MDNAIQAAGQMFQSLKQTASNIGQGVSNWANTPMQQPQLPGGTSVNQDVGNYFSQPIQQPQLPNETSLIQDITQGSTPFVGGIVGQGLQNLQQNLQHPENILQQPIAQQFYGAGQGDIPSAINLALGFLGGDINKIGEGINFERGVPNTEGLLPLGDTKGITPEAADILDGGKQMPWETPLFSPTEERLPFQAQKDLGVTPEEGRGVGGQAIPIENYDNRLETGDLHGGGATGEISPEAKDIYQTWLRNKNAAVLQGMQESQRFNDLRGEGLQGIQKFQAGLKDNPRYADVKNYFDQAREDTIAKTGQEINYRIDYLPQIWKNTSREVQQVFGSRVSERAPFNFERLFQDYQSGIEAGLTPRFKSIPDLVGWYEQTRQRLIADTTFFKEGSNMGLISPAGKTLPGWTAYDADRFPKIKSQYDNNVYSGIYKGPKPFVDMVNNALRPLEGPLKPVTAGIGFAKRTVMSVGVPGTAINPHGFNELVRAWGAFNPVRGTLIQGKYMLRPSLAKNFITENLPDAISLTKHGLELRTENERFAPTDPMSRYSRLFEGPLFEQDIPALKIRYGREVHDSMVKAGLNEDQAWTHGAKMANEMFGGIPWEQFGRSKQTQAVLQTFLFAPDWLESSARIGVGVGKALLNPLNPMGQAYRGVAMSMGLAYTTANLINYKNSGHFMWDNDINHKFDIEAGFSPEGKRRYINVFGTGFDWVKLPVEAATDIATGHADQIASLVRNRLSNPLSFAVGMIANSNALHQQVYGTAENPMTTIQNIGGVVGAAAQSFLPRYIPATIDLATGRQGIEQSIAQGLGAPLRYVGGKATQDIVTKGLAEGLNQQQIDQRIKGMTDYVQLRQKLLQGQNKGVQDAYATLSNLQKMDPNDPVRRATEAMLLKEYPQLYGIHQQLAYQQANGDESKVDPLYRRGNEQVAEKLRTYQTLPPKSAEAKQYYKNNADVGEIEKERAQYFKDNPYQGPASQFTYTPPPTPSDYVQQQMAAKNWNDPQVQQYLQASLMYGNEQRQAWGLEPVDQYGNIQGSKNFGRTFGGFTRGLSFRLPIKGGGRLIKVTGNAAGGFAAKGGKMLAKRASTRTAINQAKAKVPKVRFVGGTAGRIKGISAKVAKTPQLKMQTFKEPSIQKINLRQLARGYRSPRYSRYAYQ